MSPLSRRRLLAGAAGLAAGGLLSACALPGTTREGGTGPARSAAGPALVPALAAGGKASGALSFAHWRGEDRAVLDEIIAGFVAENPDASVRQDISPSNDYQSTALLKIRRGGVGDVFTAFRGAQFVDMVGAGLYADLSAQSFTDNYLPKLVRSGRDAAGNQLGLPYQYVFNMPLVNGDLLARAGTGAPADWDGFLALCERFKGLGVAPIAWPGGEPGNAGQLINTMVMNNAPFDDMFTRVEAGTAKVTDDWFLTTLRQYAQLAPYFQPGTLGAASEPCQQLFATGGAAMLATGTFHFTAVRKLGAAFPIDLVAPITVGAGAARFTGAANATFLLGVSTASQAQESAARFVEYLSRPQVASRYANGTVQHSTVDGVEYTDRDLKATARWLDAPVVLAPRFQFTSLDVRSAVENACVEVVRGSSPEQAAETAQAVVDQKRPR